MRSEQTIRAHVARCGSSWKSVMAKSARVLRLPSIRRGTRCIDLEVCTSVVHDRGHGRRQSREHTRARLLWGESAGVVRDARGLHRRRRRGSSTVPECTHLRGRVAAEKLRLRRAAACGTSATLSCLRCSQCRASGAVRSRTAKTPGRSTGDLDHIRVGTL